MRVRKTYEAIEQLFLAFNREPSKCTALIENYTANLMEVDDDLLIRSVNHLIANSDRLPRWTEVRNYCNTQKIMSKKESVDCPRCWGIGMVYAVYYDGSEVKSDAFQPQGDSAYYECITGRCNCENGEVYSRSMPISHYSEIVKREFATGRYLDPAQACCEIVIRKNRQMRELARTNNEG